MRSILRFVLVVVPTAVLATAVVVGVSRGGKSAGAVTDGDLQRDLKLASATIELAPAGSPLATISSLEAPPLAAPERTLRPRRSTNGTRVTRSRTPAVEASVETDPADAPEESPVTETAELASAEADPSSEAPATGGVALPRPTAIPVSFPPTAEPDVYDPGPGTVIRGGGIGVGDPCRIHGPPIYRRPRGGSSTASVWERIRASRPAEEERPTIRDRVRTARGAGESRPSIRDRVRRAS